VYTTHLVLKETPRLGVFKEDDATFASARQQMSVRVRKGTLRNAFALVAYDPKVKQDIRMGV
jgi:hypothetical protein